MQYKIGDHVVVERTNIEWIVNGKYCGKTGVIEHAGSPGFYWVRFDDTSLDANALYCEVRCFVEDANKITITTDGKTTVATLYENGRPKESATAKCSPDDEFNFVTGAKLAMERLDKKINPPSVGGFKVGDRVNIDGRNGTVIAIDGDHSVPIGVQFDEAGGRNYYSHRCANSINLIDGKPGTIEGRYYRWCDPSKLKHGEAPKYYNGKVVCVDNFGYDFLTKGKIYQFVDGRLTYDDGDHNLISIRNFDHLAKRSSAKWVEIVE